MADTLPQNPRTKEVMETREDMTNPETHPKRFSRTASRVFQYAAPMQKHWSPVLEKDPSLVSRIFAGSRNTHFAETENALRRMVRSPRFQPRIVTGYYESVIAEEEARMTEGDALSLALEKNVAETWAECRANPLQVEFLAAVRTATELDRDLAIRTHDALIQHGATCHDAAASIRRALA